MKEEGVAGLVGPGFSDDPRAWPAKLRGLRTELLEVSLIDVALAALDVDDVLVVTRPPIRSAPTC